MADRAEQIALSPAAPAAESSGALAVLQKSHMPTLSDLLPNPEIETFVNSVRDSMEFSKAINPVIVPFPSERSRQGRRGMQSVFLDEWQLNVQGDYWERPGAFTFDTLRQMVDQTPVLSAVVMTRVRQVQRFCRVNNGNSDAPGFQIEHVDRQHALDSSDKQTIQMLNRFMTNCGWEFSPRRRKALRRDSFSQFMAKSVRDTLTLDSAGIELEWKRDRSRGIDGFYAVDGGTIRMCTEHGYRGDDSLFAVQVVQGNITTAYAFDDLIYEARNPRSDVRACGYGLSETELLVRVVTGFLNAMTYNISGFDKNEIPKGMLHLSGNYGAGEIDAFKRYWNAMVKGVNSAWTLPVMVSKDQESKAAFERFGVDFNEMHFSKWMTFLVSVICAVFGMSPAEINFDSFSGGNTSPLSGGDTEEKLTASKDSGLRPILSYYENLFTDFLITDFGDQYCFRFTGLDPEDADKKHEMKKLVLTMNEARAEAGYGKIDGPLGDCPLNPPLIAAWQGMQQQGAGDFGQPAGDPDQPPNPDAPTHSGEGGDYGKKDDKDFGAGGDLPGGLAATSGGDFGAEPEGDFGKALPTIYTVAL